MSARADLRGGHQQWSSLPRPQTADSKYFPWSVVGYSEVRRAVHRQEISTDGLPVTRPESGHSNLGVNAKTLHFNEPNAVSFRERASLRDSRQISTVSEFR